MKMRATQNFAYGTAVAEAWIHGGTVLDEEDPIVAAFPSFFEPVYETVSNPAPVERLVRAGHSPEEAVAWAKTDDLPPKKVAPRRRRNG